MLNQEEESTVDQNLSFVGLCLLSGQIEDVAQGEEPGGARMNQEEPGGAKKIHEEPGGARRSKEEPGARRSR